MSTHCPGCCEVSHVSNGSTIINHTKPNTFCPGCGHEERINELVRLHDDVHRELMRKCQELALLRAVVEQARRIAAHTPRPPYAITYEVGVELVDMVQRDLCPAIDALAAWEKHHAK